MSTSRIQVAGFLSLVVLAACALANSQEECPCKCSKVDAHGDLCDLIQKQNSLVVANDEQIRKYLNTFEQSKAFFEDKATPISEIVNKLVETYINSVLKKAVTDLGIPSGNPGDSTEEHEEGLEGTRDYLTHMFKVMKNWNLEVKKKLGEVEKLYPRLKALEDDITMPKDVTDMKRILGILSSESNGTTSSDKRTAPTEEECSDETHPAYCDQIVEAKFCATQYYRKICCASCKKAGQLPSDSTSEK